jgi:hypothetical protein
MVAVVEAGHAGRRLFPERKHSFACFCQEADAREKRPWQPVDIVPREWWNPGADTKQSEKSKPLSAGNSPDDPKYPRPSLRGSLTYCASFTGDLEARVDAMAIRRPVESNFEVVCHEFDVQVTFKPTNSHYGIRHARRWLSLSQRPDSETRRRYRRHWRVPLVGCPLDGKTLG